MPSPNENEEENVAKFPDDEVEAPDTTQEQSVEIEQDDSEPVSITDFADVLGKNLVTKTDKPEAKEPEKKEEEKAELKEEPDQPDEEETLPLPGSEIEEQPVAKVATKTKVARDYSGIEDSDKPLFEKMGNETFAAMKKTYLEAREIKQKLAEIEKQPKGTSVYGHPRSYVLTKEHDELVTNVQAATTVEKHWQTQLARIRRGEKWVDMDIKDGKFVFSEPKDATAEDEANVTSWLTDASTQRIDITKQYKDYVSGYETSYKNDLTT